MNWTLKASLSFLFLLIFTKVNAQSSTEDLSNPFPLSEANVPYAPHKNELNNYNLVSHEGILITIRNAFAKMDISLEKNVLIEKGLDVYVDGYNEDQNIGFVLLDARNMDQSYYKKGSDLEFLQNDGRFNTFPKYFKNSIDSIHERMKKDFDSFLKDKAKYLSTLEKKTADYSSTEFVNRLKNLPTDLESEEKFNKYSIDLELQRWKNNLMKFSDGFRLEMCITIDELLEDNIDKLFWLNTTALFDKWGNNPEYFKVLREKFQTLKNLDSKEQFLEQYASFVYFNRYGHYSHQKFYPEFMALQISIMQSYPINEWSEQVSKLQAYKDERIIPYSVALKIDENNNTGRNFIAPICFKDALFTTRIHEPSTTENMEKYEIEKAKITEEMKIADGMTKEVRARKLQEYSKITEEYSYTKIQQMPRIQRDSLYKLRRSAVDKYKMKYAAMQKLSPEEREVFIKRIKAVENKIREERGIIANIKYKATMKRLEAEVINYIKWAQSQMGG